MAQRRLYGTLDGMRGIAAIAVVILHGPALFGPIAAPSGGLAVDLFFIMSGFIIAHAYEEKLLDRTLSRMRFIALRLIRLYPLYLIGLALGLAEALGEYHFGRAQAWTAPQILRSSLAGLFMAPAPPGIDDGHASAFRLNPPAWSLFFEMIANVLYGLVALRLSNRVLFGVVLASGAALVATALYVGDLNVGAYWNNLGGGLPRVVFSFSVGLLIYRYRERICVANAPPLLVFLLITLLFLVDPGSWTGAYQLVCILFVLPIIVVLGASVEPGPRLLPACQFLGLTSYAVYSLHYPILMAVNGGARRWFLPVDYMAAAPWLGLFVLAALLIGSKLIATLYDAPVRRRLIKMLDRFPSRAVTRSA